MAFKQILTENDRTLSRLGSTITTDTLLGRKKADGTGAITQLSTAADIKLCMGLNNVPNLNITTWTGATSLITVGTVGTGTWHGSAIAFGKGGLGSTTFQLGDMLVSNGSAWTAVNDGNGKLFKSGANTSSVGYNVIDLDTNEITGVLLPANGGTGITSLGENKSLYRYGTASAMTLGTATSISTELLTAASPATHSHSAYALLAGDTFSGKLEFGTIASAGDTIGTAGVKLSNFALPVSTTAPTALTNGGNMYVNSTGGNKLYVELLSWTA